MTTTRARGVVLLALALTLWRADAQTQQTSAWIRGRIVAADNKQPLRRALVTPGRPQQELQAAFTDDEGRFEIAIPQSATTFTVSKAGYARSTIDVTPERRKSGRDIDVELVRAAAISGRVVRPTGEPVFGARVRVTSVATDVKPKEGESVTREAETDDLGEYRVGGLTAGRYEVAPLRSRNVIEMRTVLAELAKTSGTVRQPLPPPLDLFDTGALPARVVDVRPGDEASTVDFQAERADVPDARLVASDPNAPVAVRLTVPPPERSGATGVITGLLVDQAGEPLQGVRIRALQLRRADGHTSAHSVGMDRITDDRGRYRVFGLVPGDYIISASTDAAASGIDRSQGSRFTKVYYPGTAAIESAQAVRVDEARETGGMDFAFVPERAARVSGVALDPFGEPLVGQVRLLASQRSGGVAAEPIVTRVDWDGTFVIREVPRGDFVVQAVGTNPGYRDQFGVEYVTVDDRDPAPITIVTSVGAKLEGRFTAEGDVRPPMRAYSIHAAPGDLDRAPIEGRGPDGLAVYDDGKFSLTGLRGPMRLLPGDLPAGWYVKSITIGGLDVTNSPFDFGTSEHTFTDAEIVLSRSAGTINGTVTDGPQTRASNFVAIAFSTERDLWFTGSRHVKQQRGTANGSFDIGGLPPGDYWVAAVDRLNGTDWQRSEVLDTLVSAAKRVKVAEGQIYSTELRLFRRRP